MTALTETLRDTARNIHSRGPELASQLLNEAAGALDSFAAVLAVVYHESGRQSVATGETLAASAGQAKPFTEFYDLRPDVQRGRELTARGLLERFRFTSRQADQEVTSTGLVEVARGIHEAERAAIDRGWTVIVFDPPRPWIAFDDLPVVARAGRRNQARYLLERFTIVRV